MSLSGSSYQIATKNQSSGENFFLHITHDGEPSNYSIYEMNDFVGFIRYVSSPPTTMGLPENGQDQIVVSPDKSWSAVKTNAILSFSNETSAGFGGTVFINPLGDGRDFFGSCPLVATQYYNILPNGEFGSVSGYESTGLGIGTVASTERSSSGLPSIDIDRNKYGYSSELGRYWRTTDCTFVRPISNSSLCFNQNILKFSKSTVEKFPNYASQLISRHANLGFKSTPPIGPVTNQDGSGYIPPYMHSVTRLRGGIIGYGKSFMRVDTNVGSSSIFDLRYRGVVDIANFGNPDFEYGSGEVGGVGFTNLSNEMISTFGTAFKTTTWRYTHSRTGVVSNECAFGCLSSRGDFAVLSSSNEGTGFKVNVWKVFPNDSYFAYFWFNIDSRRRVINRAAWKYADPILNNDQRYTNSPLVSTASPTCCQFSREGDALLVGSDGAEGSPFIFAYRWTHNNGYGGGSAYNIAGGFGQPYSSPSPPIPGKVKSIKFSPGGSMVIIAHEGYPYISAYRWSSVNGFGQKYDDSPELLSFANGSNDYVRSIEV